MVKIIRHHGEQGAVIYGTLSSVNCAVVVIFTPMITRIFSHRTDCQKMLIGDTLMVGSYILFRVLLGIVPSYYAVMRAEWSDIGTGVIGNREAGPYLFQYEAQALFRCRQEAEGTIERAGGAGCHIYQDQPEGHQERGHASFFFRNSALLRSS